MSLPSNVPVIRITDAGVHVPDTPSVLAGVLADYVSAFGTDLNVTTLSTPQGYLAQETTANITDVNAAVALIFNLVDPAFSSGRMQDAIGRIYFIERQSATCTVVETICTGTPFTMLPAGSLAKNDDNIIFMSTMDAQFDSGGQATVLFRSTVPGPVSCAAGELSRIAVAVPGVWDAVTNLTAGVLGSNAENRLQFERRRSQSVAKNSHSTAASIYANVVALAGVIDAYCIDNPLGEVVESGVTNYPLKPHSVFVAVVGGDDQQIGDVIWTRKDPGCDMNGNTEITVIDDVYASNNKPTYKITFLRPALTTVKFHVQVKRSPLLPNDIKALTKEAIISAFNGSYKTKDRERIAGTIYSSQYYAPILEIGRMEVISILIGVDTPDQTFITMGVDQFPVVGEDDITVDLV